MRQKIPNIYIELVADKCAINSVVKIMPSSTRSINLKEVFFPHSCSHQNYTQVRENKIR